MTERSASSFPMMAVNCRHQMRGFGLNGMKERVAALGGHLSVNGRVDEKGVILIAEIPLPVPENDLLNTRVLHENSHRR